MSAPCLLVSVQETLYYTSDETIKGGGDGGGDEGIVACRLILLRLVPPSGRSAWREASGKRNSSIVFHDTIPIGAHTCALRRESADPTVKSRSTLSYWACARLN